MSGCRPFIPLYGGHIMPRRLAVMLLVMFAAACAQLPKPELQAYRDAFTAAQTAASPLIADYATAERATRQSLLETDDSRDFAARGYFSTFDVADAVAFSSIGNPPGASAL